MYYFDILSPGSLHKVIQQHTQQPWKYEKSRLLGHFIMKIFANNSTFLRFISSLNWFIFARIFAPAGHSNKIL